MSHGMIEKRHIDNRGIAKGMLTLNDLTAPTGYQIAKLFRLPQIVLVRKYRPRRLTVQSMNDNVGKCLGRPIPAFSTLGDVIACLDDCSERKNQKGTALLQLAFDFGIDLFIGIDVFARTASGFSQPAAIPSTRTYL